MSARTAVTGAASARVCRRWSRATRGWWCSAAFRARPRWPRRSTTRTRATSSGPCCRRCGASDLRALAYAQRLAEAAPPRPGPVGRATPSCRREGSLDSAIARRRAATTWPACAGAAPQLRGDRPQRRRIGARDAHHAPRWACRSYRLPSSSPANASWSFERKLAAWRAVFAQPRIAVRLMTGRTHAKLPTRACLPGHDLRIRRRALPAPGHALGAGRDAHRQARRRGAGVRAAHAGLDAVASAGGSWAEATRCSSAWAPAAITRFTLPGAAHAHHRGRAQPRGHRRLPPLVPAAGRRRAAAGGASRCRAWVRDAARTAGCGAACCVSTCTTTRPPRRCSTTRLSMPPAARCCAEGGVMSVNLFGREASFERSAGAHRRGLRRRPGVAACSPTREGNTMVVARTRRAAARSCTPGWRGRLTSRPATALPARKWLRMVRPLAIARSDT